MSRSEFDLEAFRKQVEEALTTHEAYLTWLREYRESVNFTRSVPPIRDSSSLLFKWINDTFEESFSWFHDQGENPCIEVMLLRGGGQQTFEVPRWVQMLVICEEQRELNTGQLPGSFYSFDEHRAMIEQIATLLYGPLAGYSVVHMEEETPDFTMPHVSRFEVCIAHGLEIMSDWDMNYTELHELRAPRLAEKNQPRVCAFCDCDLMFWLPPTDHAIMVNDVFYHVDRIRSIRYRSEQTGDIVFWYSPNGPLGYDPYEGQLVQVTKKDACHQVVDQFLKERTELVAGLKKQMEETR